MDLPEGYQLRAPVRDDLEAVAAVVVAHDADQSGHSTLGADFVVGEWNRIGDLAADAWAVVEPSGAVVAYAQIEVAEPGIVESWGAVHPAHRGRGLGSALFDRIEQRALAHAPAALRHKVNAADRAAARLLHARGLRPIRHFWHLQIDFTEPLATPSNPEGLQITASPDPASVHRVINEALEGHWDYHPLPFDEWITQERKGPGHDPAQWLLATEAGQPIGALVASRWEESGWVDWLGVLASHRGRGVATALLRHAFAGAASRGQHNMKVSVDAANETSATQVYERAGMRIVYAWDMWERHPVDIH